MKDSQKLRETLMDTVMGDLKDQVALVESNGLRTFSLTLDEGNMPILIQTAFSAGSLHSESKIPDAFDMTILPAELQDVITDMKDYRNMVDISNERKLEKVMISLTVDSENQPVAMALSTSFSGVSTDGTAHAYEITCNMALSGINTTIPDEANVNPSSIIKIDTTPFENTRKGPMMHR